MDADTNLKPRIETIPVVSDKTLQLFNTSLVWDDLLPWGPVLNGPHIDKILPRFHAAGVNFVSLTVAVRDNTEKAFAQIAEAEAQIHARSEYLTVARTTHEIHDARDAGKLALGFHFQETMPFGTDLDNVEAFYNLGVRQALLAYNNRNFVGDGCAEPDDAGLSLFGRALVEEMNRVGMLVDGSHSGYRTAMEATELSQGPFIYSHSNPFAIRPHYRSIKDDQIKACAATGGVIGINGVGYWVGDNDAPTEAIFRCLDYTVELAGPEHVGLGFDYIYDLDEVVRWARSTPLVWPPYEGESMPKHNYAGPEQMVELVELMLGHGYPDAAIVGILGGNWERVSEAVWK
ncbi:MAG TPA: membrane dipeptidase [Solirubrobacteraceae bacterium]|nr:membrane dipeptidase [Solirubrobacteraceae bacterium]